MAVIVLGTLWIIIALASVELSSGFKNGGFGSRLTFDCRPEGPDENVICRRVPSSVSGPGLIINPVEHEAITPPDVNAN